MFVLYSKACLCFKKRILIVFSGWLAVVTQFSIHTNLCSVSVAVMEPQFCLSSSLVRRKECLSPGIWLKGACWPISCPVSGTTGSPNTQTVFPSLLSSSTWLENCTSHFLKARGEDCWVAVRDSLPKLVYYGDGANASFQVPTVWHLTTCSHYFTMTLHPWSCCSVNWRLCAFCSLCTLSPLSWLAVRRAAVDWSVLDCVHPHGSYCDLKAYLH